MRFKGMAARPWQRGFYFPQWCTQYSFCVCCKWYESFQADAVVMVNMASDAFKLQLTSVIMHEEVFCIVFPTNSRQGISYFRSFQCVHGASSRRDTSIVVRGFGVWHYKEARQANIPIASNPSVDNSWFSKVRDSWRLLTPRICCVPMVRTGFGGETFIGARKTNIW